MTPTQILPDLTPDELDVFALWLRRLPFAVYQSNDINEQAKQLSYELLVLADLRRKG